MTGVCQISELPCGRWTEDYKEFLHNFIKRRNFDITSVIENHTVDSVRFEIVAPKVLIVTYLPFVIHTLMIAHFLC
jgi:hypothetical protein